MIETSNARDGSGLRHISDELRGDRDRSSGMAGGPSGHVRTDPVRHPHRDVDPRDHLRLRHHRERPVSVGTVT